MKHEFELDVTDQAESCPTTRFICTCGHGAMLCGKATIGSRYGVRFHGSLTQEATEAFLCAKDGKADAVRTLPLVGNIEGHNTRSTQLVIVRQKADIL
jgi:hypothetical protein